MNARKLKPIEITPAYRARLNCQIGRDALEVKPLPIGVSAVEYALFCLLNAVEELAAVIDGLKDGTE